MKPTARVAPEALVARIEACLAGQSMNSLQRYASDLLIQKVVSKYSTGTISAPAERSALLKFQRGCIHTESFNRTGWQGSDLFDQHILGTFRSRCMQFFESIPQSALASERLYRSGGVGPGKSAGSPHTDFLRKLYAGPTSATSRDVLLSYLKGSATNPLDHQAVRHGLDVFGCVVDDCSRISFVEKNVNEARTIASEPSLNMFFQLAIGDLINDRLGKVYSWSKSKTPDVNRVSAFLGSLDGSLATIDLQSASDSISLGLCKYSLPGYWYETLCHYRCSYSQLPSGEIVRLPMISTMGNGWTFSLMTALLYCMLHAVVDLSGSPGDLAHCSVYGDDIIVPKKLYNVTLRALKLLGFIVNTEKSFNEGFFRESCGHDYYNGHFVRPVYIRKLGTLDSTNVAFNRLAEWSAFHSVSLTPVLEFLWKILPSRNLVPRWCDFSSGIRAPSHLARHLLHKGGTWRYYRLEAVPVSYDVTDEPVRVRSISPSVNPDGVYIALLGGYLRNGRIAERSEKKVQWRLSRRVTPNWDFRDSEPCPGWTTEAERRWESTVARVISSG